MNKYKEDFPILKNNNIAYIDSGATSQKPLQVINAIDNFYKNYNANPHRGAYSLSIEATNLYENTRTKIAKFINAKHREEIIFSKNATESLNLLAYSYGIDKLKEDDEIVFIEVKTRSNVACGRPSEAVNQVKQKHIKKATKYYIYLNKLENYYIRIDVIEVYLKNNKFYINHIKQII